MTLDDYEESAALLDEAPPSKWVIRGDEFMADFECPAHVIDGILPGGRIYTLTGQTGHGKTAIAATAAACVLTGRNFAGYEVDRGRVLFLAGENPHDFNARLIATFQEMGLHSSIAHDLLVIPMVFDLQVQFGRIKAGVQAHGDVKLVVVDSVAAFFSPGGSDENSNAEMLRHASNLRALTTLPGSPAVLALAHPTKSATRESLLPRGGGSFLAEIDGNLTAWKDDASIVTLSWAGKLRGPGFTPFQFELKPVDLAGITDPKGRAVKSVFATPIDGNRAEILEQAAMTDENSLLLSMLRHPDATVEKLAMACGWTNGMGTANKSRVSRTAQRLQAIDLVKKARSGAWKLTPKGHKEATELIPEK